MYVVKKVTNQFNQDGTLLSTKEEPLGFVAGPDEFNRYMYNNYSSKPNFALALPDIKTYGMGSKAITVVDISKITCPPDSDAIFIIVCQQYEKLV